MPIIQFRLTVKEFHVLLFVVVFRYDRWKKNSNNGWEVNVIVLAEKGSHTKEVLAVLGRQSVCQMSRKEREVDSPSELSSENMFRLNVSIFEVW